MGAPRDSPPPPLALHVFGGRGAQGNQMESNTERRQARDEPVGFGGSCKAFAQFSVVAAAAIQDNEASTVDDDASLINRSSNKCLSSRCKHGMIIL